MQEIAVEAAPLAALEDRLTEQRREPFIATLHRGRALLADRTVWDVNATASGGGVAEMLAGLLAFGRGAGVDTRRLVLDGDPGFFAITKRVHNALHGTLHPGAELVSAEYEHYDRVMQKNLTTMTALVRADDIVILHDPQTAGLCNRMGAIHAHVIWRSHIGRDESNDATDTGWQFLRPYLDDAHAFVGRVMRRVGVIECGGDDDALTFTRRDGTAGVVRRHSNLIAGSAPPHADAPLAVRVSRWDRLKEMPGVLSAFAEHVAAAVAGAYLMLAGPDLSGVNDDPESAEELAECRATWTQFAQTVRKHCHLACVPMDDYDENAVIVNALQRHASVVVQTSLFEGFGLTLIEATWKGRAVLASAIGGIQDKVVDGHDGLLLPDPTDLDGFAQRLELLLDNPPLREQMGRAAHDRVRIEFLGDRHSAQYVDLFEDLLTS